MGRPPRPLTPNASAAHLFGAELRRARENAGWSLEQLRDRCRDQGRVLHRGWLAHVEHGGRLPEDRDFAEIADSVLETDGLLTRLWEFADTARTASQDETRQSRMAVADLVAQTLSPIMNGDIVYVPYIVSDATVAYMRMTRRSFLATGGLATSSLVSGLFAHDDLAVADAIAADILAGDPRRMTTAQTSHAIDLTIASLISTGGMRPTPLTKWMREGDPVLKVNAAGIAAKMPGSDLAESAIASLITDHDTRTRYLTAVLARIWKLDWATAQAWAGSSNVGQHVRTSNLPALADELGNRHDAGARWCATVVLANVWATNDHPARETAVSALEAALADEPLPTLRTTYGRALSRRNVIN